MQRINNPYSYWLSLYSTRLTERTSSRATTNEQVAPLYKCGNPMLFSTPTHTCRQMPTCFTLIQPPHLITVPLPLEAHICSPSPPMHTQREAHHRHNTEMHVQAGAGSSRFNPSPKPSSSLVCQGVGGVPGWGCCPPSTSWSRAINPRCELFRRELAHLLAVVPTWQRRVGASMCELRRRDRRWYRGSLGSVVEMARLHRSACRQMLSIRPHQLLLLLLLLLRQPLAQTSAAQPAAAQLSQIAAAPRFLPAVPHLGPLPLEDPEHVRTPLQSLHQRQSQTGRLLG